MNHFENGHKQKGIIPIIIIIIALLVIGGGIVVAKKISKSNEDRANNDNNSAQNQDNGQKNRIGDEATTTASVPATIEVTLNPQNNSGQKGKAVITQADGKLKVIVNLSGQPSSAVLPSHIHLGSCVNLGGVVYPLTSISKGVAQTTLNITMADLVKQLPLAINVHKSAQEINVYTACGDITSAGFKGVASSASAISKDSKDAAEKSSSEKAKENAAKNSVKQMVKVTYNGSSFNPSIITINKGDTVTFVNNSNVSFWPASNPHPSHTDYPGFDARRNITSGESYSFTFDRTGTWGYHNHLSASVGGTVVVK